MAKFKPMELIDKMHGKFSGESEYYAAEKYGTQYTGKVGEITVPPTEAQVQNCSKFATARANMLSASRQASTSRCRATSSLKSARSWCKPASV